MRIDEILVKEGLAPDISIARSLCMEGRVLIGTNKILKPSEEVKSTEGLRVMGEINPYVSRGAHKLLKAIEVFNINLQGLSCIDIGSSTGGFTDVMLRHGASKVYAVDVGYNQLDYKLRVNPKVCVMERQNARFLKEEMFSPLPEFGATDVSFISLKTILPVCLPLINGNSFVALIKPQFEAPKNKVGKKGVVRSKDVHYEVVSDIINFVIGAGYYIGGLDFSPITGPEGNIEFLLHICKQETNSFNCSEILYIIDEAYDKLVKSAQ